MEGLAGVGELSLPVGQGLLEHAAVVGQARNGRLRFGLAHVDGVDRLAGTAAFGGDEVDALPHARFIGGGPGHVRLRRDDRLLVTVAVGHEAGHGGAGDGDGIARSRRARRPARQSPAGRRATFSRRSRISRLVARMPVDSVRLPPLTTCGPR